MRPSNSTPRYLRKLYLLQEFGSVVLGWRLVLLSHYILVSGASLNITYFMSCDINLAGEISKVYCLWATNGQPFVACEFLHASSFYGLHLQVLPRRLIRFEMRVEESRPV